MRPQHVDDQFSCSPARQGSRPRHAEFDRTPGYAGEGPPKTSSPPSFASRRSGEPIYPDTVTSLVAKLVAAYNAPKDRPKPDKPLPHARLHDLRHVHATTLLLAGVPVHVVAARLGHTDPAITLRVYAHVIVEQMAAAAGIFATAVKGAAA
ncbi:tyrosine-type recombinase/integrase [Sphaerisporangium aureirubrum]|uniref:Tyrosine-type recombinase/integrase n=1 Tax=Sphaerisporangium aureirubrum TaxID=1544736 RepID=A0ABW1NBE6_9ACTN